LRRKLPAQVRQEIAALRDFNPAYVADGSFTSTLAKHVRFAPKADKQQIGSYVRFVPQAAVSICSFGKAAN
jgi:hypothetical protein